MIQSRRQHDDDTIDERFISHERPSRIHALLRLSRQQRPQRQFVASESLKLLAHSNFKLTSPLASAPYIAARSAFTRSYTALVASSSSLLLRGLHRRGVAPPSSSVSPLALASSHTAVVDLSAIARSTRGDGRGHPRLDRDLPLARVAVHPIAARAPRRARGSKNHLAREARSMLEYGPSSVRARRRSPNHILMALRAPHYARTSRCALALEGRGATRARARPSTRSMQGYGYGHPPPGCVKTLDSFVARGSDARSSARAMRARKSRPETRDLEGRVKMGVEDGRRARRGRDRARGRESERWIGVDRARGRARRDE